jgi:predicted ATPase
MITKLRIQNFKCWQDTGEIRMSPLTLLFGTNSSGKSSIGQFLMMLKQTVETPDRKVIFFPGAKNSAVQLGSFQEMIYGREADGKISFDYEWDLPEKLEVIDPISKVIFFVSFVGFGVKNNRG